MRLRYLAHLALFRWTADPDHQRKARKLAIFLAQDKPGSPIEAPPR